VVIVVVVVVMVMVMMVMVVMVVMVMVVMMVAMVVVVVAMVMVMVVVMVVMMVMVMMVMVMVMMVVVMMVVVVMVVVVVVVMIVTHVQGLDSVLYTIYCHGAAHHDAGTTEPNVWTVNKRYKSFEELHKTLLELDPRVAAITFPPKTGVFSSGTDDKVCAARPPRARAR
jgi:hypothetical protein